MLHEYVLFFHPVSNLHFLFLISFILNYQRHLLHLARYEQYLLNILRLVRSK